MIYLLYILWSLLNIGLLVFFIVICFKSTKLVREKLGLLSSLVFVFGLLSFTIHSNNSNRNKESGFGQIRTWNYAPADSLGFNANHSFFVLLEKTGISEYDLCINYDKDKMNHLNIPVSAYSTTTGFISGTYWEPASILVNRTPNNNEFGYYVRGQIEWKLLGATIYSQSKEYKGVATIE